MKELNFDSGLVTYALNGKCEVTFNPADRAFATRFFDAFDGLRKLYDECGKKVHEGAAADASRIADEYDRKMQEIIDGLFGIPVCDAALGNMSICAFANGFPVWLNIMLTVMDEILENLGEIEKQADPRIAKYKAKYQKYSARYHT